MPALNFTMFVAKVRSGMKRQTIRAGNRFHVGDTLYLFTGMRTKKCCRLGTEVCTAAIPIIMDDPDGVVVILDNDILLGEGLEYLALLDGFDSADRMLDWFGKTHGWPFVGQVIRW